MGRVLALSLCPPIGCWDHEVAILGRWGSVAMRRGEQAMVAGEIGSGSGYQSRKLGEELKRLEDEVGGAVVEGVFQFIQQSHSASSSSTLT